MANKNLYTGLDLNDNKIQGIADGTLATDVASKGQVDTALTDAQAYTDGKILGLGEYVAKLDPASGIPTVGSGDGGAIDKNDWWHIDGSGTIIGEAVHKGERLQALVNNPDTADNTGTNTDWAILHDFHVEDSRYEIDNVALTADTPLNINHALGKKFVQVTVADVDGKRIDLDVDYVDTDNLTLESTVNVNVYGVISL